MKENVSSGSLPFCGGKTVNCKIEMTFWSGWFVSSGDAIRRLMQKVIRYVPWLFFLVSASCMASEITQAGFAFSGDYKTAAQRFPYTFELFKRVQAGKNVTRSFSFLINERSKKLKNPEIEFN